MLSFLEFFRTDEDIREVSTTGFIDGENEGKIDMLEPVDILKTLLAPIIHLVSFSKTFILIFTDYGHNNDVLQVLADTFFIATPLFHAKLQLSPRR